MIILTVCVFLIHFCGYSFLCFVRRVVCVCAPQMSHEQEIAHSKHQQKGRFAKREKERASKSTRMAGGGGGFDSD
jgi:hypothetical protein